MSGSLRSWSNGRTCVMFMCPDEKARLGGPRSVSSELRSSNSSVQEPPAWSMKRPIEDYALLSDLETAALVHRRGSIEWCCFPRFDSDACFAALLGHREHGRWLARRRRRPAIRRAAIAMGRSCWRRSGRRARGRVRVVDFMPPRGEAPVIVRTRRGALQVASPFARSW